MKVLIWKKEKDLSNCGGDTGYLWNLNFFLKKENIKEIEFIDKNFVKRDLIKRLEKRKDEIKNFFVSSKFFNPTSFSKFSIDCNSGE